MAFITSHKKSTSTFVIMKSTLLSILLMLTTTFSISQTNQSISMKLIYVFDPLCGWCYGFSPVIKEFAEKHSDELSVELYTGGMVTGDRIGPIGEVAGYISTAYKDVEKATGIEFGAPFLNNIMQERTAIFTSLPSSKAFAIFKLKYPKKALEYASLLQRAIYFEGRDPSDIEYFADLAASLGYQRANFLEQMQSSHSDSLMENDFQFAKRLGVTGYPMVIIEANNQLYAIARGFLPLEQLEQNFEQLKKQHLR